MILFFREKYPKRIALMMVLLKSKSVSGTQPKALRAGLLTAKSPALRNSF